MDLKRENWKYLKLKDVCTIIMGQSPPSETYNSVGDGLPFFQGKAEFTDLHPIAEKWCTAANKIAEANDILLSVRAPVGSTNIADTKCGIGRGLAALRFENFKYGYYFLKSKQQELDSKGTGTTFKAISGDTIKETIIPYPDSVTQEIIVQKIEELFSELDKCLELLKTVQEQEKVFRQSVLNYAFEGRLTNKGIKKGVLPKDWNIVKLRDVVSILGDGLHGTPKYSENGDYYFINGNNLSNGNIVFKSSTKRVSKEEFVKYKKNLTDRTILVSINGTLGNVAFYNNEKVILGKSACYFNLLNNVDKHYMKLILKGKTFLNYAHETATGSTIPNVSLKAMREFEFPLPPTKEQEQIVKEVESRLIVADKIIENVVKSILQIETLKQSILKKAFDGELTI